MNKLDGILIRYGKFKIRHTKSPSKRIGMFTNVLFGMKIVRYNVLRNEWIIYNNRR